MTRADIQALLREPVIRWLLAGLATLVVGGAVAWGTILANQTRIQRALDGLEFKAPAPADTTRWALQSLQRQINVLEADVRDLRKDLGKPR
jgi:hypothetical protein